MTLGDTRDVLEEMVIAGKKNEAIVFNDMRRAAVAEILVMLRRDFDRMEAIWRWDHLTNGRECGIIPSTRRLE